MAFKVHVDVGSVNGHKLLNAFFASNGKNDSRINVKLINNFAKFIIFLSLNGKKISQLKLAKFNFFNQNGDIRIIFDPESTFWPWNPSKNKMKIDFTDSFRISDLLHEISISN